MRYEQLRDGVDFQRQNRHPDQLVDERWMLLAKYGNTTHRTKILKASILSLGQSVVLESKGCFS